MMTPEEKRELRELLEEEAYRRDGGLKTERATKRIGGVEQTILLVHLKLRPPYAVEAEL